MTPDQEYQAELAALEAELAEAQAAGNARWIDACKQQIASLKSNPVRS